MQIKGWILGLVMLSFYTSAAAQSQDRLQLPVPSRLPLTKTETFSVKQQPLNQAYYNRLGFMCKQEVKWEKATKTSLRVRLGSVDHTDKMEGKFAPVRQAPGRR